MEHEVVQGDAELGGRCVDTQMERLYGFSKLRDTGGFIQMEFSFFELFGG